MNRKILLILIAVMAVILTAELGFLVYMNQSGDRDTQLQSQPSDSTGEPSQSVTEEIPSEVTTEATEEEDPTEETTLPEEDEPENNRFVLTFVGDCTLASAPNHVNNPGGFIKTIGEDYDYPFANVVEYFENDDFTMINLEGVLADEGTPAAGKTFTFKGPTAYTQILTGSSVEAVTLANNHTLDYGKAGLESTTTALESAGVSYVKANQTMLYTTESGLVIGVYAASFDLNLADMRSDIASLRSQGADIVIAALHWGNEGKYRPNSNQINWGHAAIDYGADIVYGHHPHVLQKIEEYGDGIIYYSLGNFCFGGNHFPRDMDSVIIQQEIIREEDGSCRLGELTLIPVSISSMKGQNNFQPIPYEVGSAEYDRTMSKLDGTFDGPDLVVDYSHLEDPTEPTDPAEPSDPTEPSDPGTGDGGETGGDTSGGETTGGESTGGESTGGESTGGETTGGESTGGESTGITDGSSTGVTDGSSTGVTDGSTGGESA